MRIVHAKVTYMAYRGGRQRGALGKQTVWDKVERKGEEECWLWTGKVIKAGYGRVSYRGKVTIASRAAWLETYGPDSIPEGLFVLHSCDNPPCCNPHHLHLGTKAENTDEMMARRRSYWAERDECSHGHEYTPENTRWVTRKSGQRYRQCARCKAESYLRAKAA